MTDSLAKQAHKQQNLDIEAPRDTRFPRHDIFQNGIVEKGQPTTFYTAATDKDIENIKSRNSSMSGFLSDESTINSCKNADGVLDANKYADKSQTQPWRPPESPRGTDYTYRENVAAFDVNWDALNEPKNADLKERLCDSDGNLKCAFGKAEENTHWGEGGGNQYYINKDDFNEGVNRGVFQYNEDKTLKESNGDLVRRGVSEDEYKIMEAERQDNIDKQLSSCEDKNATTDVEKARSLNEITPEKAEQINSAQATKGEYLARPDPAYNYNQGTSTSYTHGTSAETGSTNKVSAGGGARAPNTIDTSNSNAKRGKVDDAPIEEQGVESVPKRGKTTNTDTDINSFKVSSGANNDSSPSTALANSNSMT